MQTNRRPGTTSDGTSVLVVDDHPLVLEVVRRLLLRHGFRVETAGNGEDALDRLTNGDGGVDLLLTDIDMPGLDGRSLAERVRPGWPDLPILLMSGRPGSGGDSFPVLSKPFRHDDLLEMIRRTMDGG